jgi:TRAP-type C4-dicarboxylate transport system permease small subunit
MDDLSPSAAAPINWLDRLATIANAIGAVALIGIVVVQSWQVFARYVINASPSWTEPVAGILLSTAMCFGAAVMVRREAHFGFVLLRDRAPPMLREALMALVDSIIAGIGLTLAGWGAVLLIDGWRIPMAGAGLPQSSPYLPVVLGGGLIALFAFDALRRRAAKWLKR